MKTSAKMWFIVLGLVFSFCPAGVRCATTNLLVNGDFSQKEKSFPAGWGKGGNRFSQQEGATMDVVYDEGMPFADGLPALKVTQYSPPDAKGSFRFVSKPFPVEHGKIYKFSVWLRANNPLTVSFSFDGWSGELAEKLGKDYRHWFHRPAGVAQLDEQWREYSLTTRIPGPGDAGYCSEMKSIHIILEPEKGNGTYWIAKASVVLVE